MITILLSSIILAFISYPMYKKLRRKISNKSFSIILALFIIAMIILIPFAFLAFEITREGIIFHNSLSSKIEKGTLFGFGCTSADSKVCSLINRVEKFSTEHLSQFGFTTQIQKILPFLEEKITTFILGIPLLIAEIFLTFVIAYFILKEWRSILQKIEFILPLRTKTKNSLVLQFGNITHAIIYTQLFVALVIGIVATIGFFVFGVPFPMVLGILVAFCTLIPTAGTAIIWVPASLYLLLSGYFSHNYWVLAKGIGLFLYCIIIVNYIDNILLARIMRAKTKVNQIVVIIGVIGGAAMFGFVGIFIGPILLPLLLTYFETFKQRFV